MPMDYHVAKTGSNQNEGSAKAPFLTIQAAAERARPGDTVTVHAGEYREWVNPRHGGRSNSRRICYRAAPGERVVIKGSERVQSWAPVRGTVWKAVLPNTLFGGYNPYADPIVGDWLEYRSGKAHTGEVYLNGRSFYEAECLEDVYEPAIRHTVLDNWTEEEVPVADPDQTRYLWYAQVEEESTSLWANFHGADPNAELVEINVRQCCFYPEATGLGYISVSGFELCHAATPWAPPTGDQPGLIGPHWAKGWVIENNIIHDAKCSAVSIGKEKSTGHNYRTFRGDKPGYQYQQESVFAALKIGWSRETIGSHIIRNNTIYDCGQNAIVGHLGCIFSEVYGNHIYNIGLKREFYGHEIAGIKLHAAIDVHIHHNNIHHCSLGTWMDWQAQGTRISHNVYHHNNRDLFIEVTHGPHIVDHNILGSRYALDNHAQGGAYVHNLLAGKMVLCKILQRATPYHSPHSTDVAGYAMVYGGDDRWRGNLFIGGSAPAAVDPTALGGEAVSCLGTAAYNGHTTSMQEYMDAVAALEPGDQEIFDRVAQPVYIEGNGYLNGALPFAREADKLELPGFDPAFSVEEAEDGVYLVCTLPPEFDAFTQPVQTTGTLPNVRIADADFETPLGEPLALNTDLQGALVPEQSVAGPIAALKAGANRVKVWPAQGME